MAAHPWRVHRRSRGLIAGPWIVGLGRMREVHAGPALRASNVAWRCMHMPARDRGLWERGSLPESLSFEQAERSAPPIVAIIEASS